jgi:hypothetical protein
MGSALNIQRRGCMGVRISGSCIQSIGFPCRFPAFSQPRSLLRYSGSPVGILFPLPNSGCRGGGKGDWSPRCKMHAGSLSTSSMLMRSTQNPRWPHTKSLNEELQKKLSGLIFEGNCRRFVGSRQIGARQK